ncbi:MAG: hypothetical protein IT503_00985 [Burkholderiaceae bacterium]|nr:hypothetical protein [Burkholderiaceae bacterium]
MPLKTVYAVVAVVLMLLYLSPVLFRLKELDLAIVMIVGVAMMLLDVWQSLKSKEE